MKRIFLRLAFSLLLVSFAHNTGFACFSYGNGNPSCYEYYKSDAIFVGTVKAVENFKIAFAVEESFLGDASREITVFDSYVCGYGDFKVGKKYLVYAQKNMLLAKGNLTVGGTSKIIEFPKAEKDVDELRNFLNAADSSIYGSVYTFNKGGLAGTKITISGDGQLFETFTDNQGEFSIANLALGSYSVKADLPSGFRDNYGEKPQTEFTVKLRRGECGKVDFTGRIKKKGWF